MQPRGVARVTQIIAAPGHAEGVADDLLATAARERLVAVTGRTQPALLDALMLRRCVFVHRSSTMVHCRSPEILDALERGDAFINGVAGETWMRLIGGEFQG